MTTITLPGCCRALSRTARFACSQTLKDQVEIVLVINAEDIEKNKVRGDLGIPYQEDALRLMDIFHGAWGCMWAAWW